MREILTKQLNKDNPQGAQDINETIKLKTTLQCARDTNETIKLEIILSVRKILTKQSNERQSSVCAR